MAFRANPPIPGAANAGETAPPAMPMNIKAAGPAVAMAWAMEQTGAVQHGEVDDEAFRLVSVTRADARELAQSWRYEIVGGPPQGYRGGALLDALPDGHEAVLAAMTVVRCQRYEAQLQSMAPALQRAVVAAQKAAELAAYEASAADFERYHRQVDELANSPRTGGAISGAIRPPRREPDLTEVRRAQARLDAMAGEISAVRRRKDAASAAASATLSRIADAAARMLWIGPQPGMTPDMMDWSEMYTAYDVLLELTGKDQADEMMDKAVKRWGRRQ